MILGKIRFDHFQSEPHYIQPLRQMMMQFRRTVGPENFDKMLEDFKPAMHALAAALFDSVTGVNRSDTIERLKRLSVPHRVAVESIVTNMTGRNQGDRHHDRWDDSLWSARRAINQICTMSISGISPEDIRAGYDELVHAIVDELYERRNTLVS